MAHHGGGNPISTLCHPGRRLIKGLPRALWGDRLRSPLVLAAPDLQTIRAAQNLSGLFCRSFGLSWRQSSNCRNIGPRPRLGDPSNSEARPRLLTRIVMDSSDGRLAGTAHRTRFDGTSSRCRQEEMLNPRGRDPPPELGLTSTVVPLIRHNPLNVVRSADRAAPDISL